MGLTDISRNGVRAAIAEGRELGQARFRSKYGFAPATRYLVDAGAMMLEPKAVVAAAHALQLGRSLTPADFSGGQSAANAALRRAGAIVVDTERLTVEGELAWRLDEWAHISARQQADNWLSAREVRDRRLYGGQAGIYVDTAQTRRVADPGVAVSILHTGDHYPDALTDDRITYHYPRTDRSGRTDQNEVDATKRTIDLELPIFVVTEEAPGNARKLYLGWVVSYSDSDETFTIVFDHTRPDELNFEPADDDTPFELEQQHDRRPGTGRRAAGRKMFKVNVLRRYGAACPLSGLRVPQMLEAAHLRDVEHDGTHDPRNGIPLNAALHRAFDARLFAFDPETLDVITRPGGPRLEEMGITTPNLRALHKRPHPDAIAWRLNDCRRRWETA